MKKILILCLALVLALGSLGVAGALWWDWLYIDGYVYTGDIGAEWSIEAYYDNEAADKDVSSIDAYLVGPNGLWIDIYNAYPSVTYTVAWDIHCTGSVPIHFAEPWIDTDLPAGTEFTFVVFNAAGEPIPWSDVQLHNSEWLYGTLTIHLDNTAEQDWGYYFYIELQYGQYNEF
jgi:hypothetical protein